MQTQSTYDNPESFMDDDFTKFLLKYSQAPEPDTKDIQEISHMQEGVEISLVEQVTQKVNDQKVNDQKQEANRSTGQNSKEQIPVDLEAKAEIEKEVDYIIENRKNCIRKECIKGKKRLDLGSSRIDDLDALTMSIYLNEQHVSLELLHLGANLITDEGLINILSGLQGDTNLKELYLGMKRWRVKHIII